MRMLGVVVPLVGLGVGAGDGLGLGVGGSTSTPFGGTFTVARPNSEPSARVKTNVQIYYDEFKKGGGNTR